MNLNENKYIIVGKILKPYGILGWLHLFSFTEKKKNLFKYHPLLIKKFISKKKYIWKKLLIQKWKIYKKQFIIKIKKINDRTEAEKFNTINIFIHEKTLPKSNDTEYYWKDIIGCTIYKKNKKIGLVYKITNNTIYDILIVKVQYMENNNINIKYKYIPFIEKKIIKLVNIKKKIILIE
ncbi:ribosome maturation factor RimM [Buchnera aphidicola (Kurisakia onigurumii)]|uniref:ribosome maturation factor RimM n=1 Tax=Buchnera aphidicola TaxID=9 RepID=UPI0031B68242